MTDTQIKQAVRQGATDLRQLREELGVASQCGNCACLAREIIESSSVESPFGNTALAYQLA